MAATIDLETGQPTATIDGYEWTSDDKNLAEYLNTMLDPLGPSGADPNPDLTAAQEAVKELGGKVVLFDEVESVPGRVY